MHKFLIKYLINSIITGINVNDEILVDPFSDIFDYIFIEDGLEGKDIFVIMENGFNDVGDDLRIVHVH